MVRLVAIALFGTLALVLAGIALSGVPALWAHTAVVVLILFGLVYERFRYKALQATKPGGSFEPSGERFIDPESGRPVTVYTGPGGERRYVEDDAALP